MSAQTIKRFSEHLREQGLMLVLRPTSEELEKAARRKKLNDASPSRWYPPKGSRS